MFFSKVAPAEFHSLKQHWTSQVFKTPRDLRYFYNDKWQRRGLCCLWVRWAHYNPIEKEYGWTKASVLLLVQSCLMSQGLWAKSEELWLSGLNWEGRSHGSQQRNHIATYMSACKHGRKEKKKKKSQQTLTSVVSCDSKLDDPNLLHGWGILTAYHPIS